MQTRIRTTGLHVGTNSGVAVSRHDAAMGLWPGCVTRKPCCYFGRLTNLSYWRSIRHLGDVYLEQGRPELAEPCYHEALELYREHADDSSLDLANSVRSLAVLRWEQTRTLWEDVRVLYTSLNLEEGIKESTARVTVLLTY